MITNGGDLFCDYWEAKTGKLYGCNASGGRRWAALQTISAREEGERWRRPMPFCNGIDP